MKECKNVSLPCNTCGKRFTRDQYIDHECHKTLKTIVDSFDQTKIIELAYKILQGKDSTEIGNFLIHDLPDTIP